MCPQDQIPNCLFESRERDFLDLGMTVKWIRQYEVWHRNHYKRKKYWTPVTSSQGRLLISCEKRSQRDSHRPTSYLRTSQDRLSRKSRVACSPTLDGRNKCSHGVPESSAHLSPSSPFHTEVQFHPYWPKGLPLSLSSSLTFSDVEQL